MTPLEPYSKAHPDRTEHTQLGLGIGALRDAVFGAPTTDDDRRSQAQFNDEIAHIAADVVASLPHIRWFGAGTLRAAALMDPNATDAATFLGTGLLNFAGGAGMNKIARSGSFGFIQDNTARKLGLSASAEAATHFQTGVALGMTRGLTDSRQWTGQDGHLQAPDLGAAVRLSLLSGVANIPAGFAGSRIAAMSSAEGDVMSRIFTGTASGGVSGGMFGATDGYLRQGDLGEAFSGFVSGALTGAAAGGITAGAERGRQDLLYTVAKKFRNPPIEEGTSGPLLGTEPLTTNAQRALDTHGEALSFSPKTYRLADLTEQLGTSTPDQYRQLTLNPFGPKNFWSDRQFKSNLVSTLRPAVMYEVNGMEIRVPTDYAKRLEPVRQLRLAAEDGNAQAAKQLADHPLGNRLLPEDVIPLIGRLPNQNKLREIELLDKPNAWNAWYREFNDWARVEQKRGNNFTAVADASEWADRIRFYRGRTDGSATRELRQIWDHEQVHLNHDPLYKAARNADETVEAHRYGYLNNKESEAELESIAFWGSSQTFIEATQRAPIRMTLLAKKLHDTIAKSPNGGGTEADGLRARINYINENVSPIALDKLIEAVKNPANRSTRGDLTDLIQRLNGTMSAEQLAAITHSM